MTSYRTLEREHEEAEHRLLCHADGTACADGCDKAAIWCQCGSIQGEQRHRTGWLVCGKCRRPVGGQ